MCEPDCRGQMRRAVAELPFFLRELGTARITKGVPIGCAAAQACPSKRPPHGSCCPPRVRTPLHLQVGPGIYSGRVKHDATGQVVWGRQYANHNPTPGPVYNGDGYTAMAKAIHAGPEAVQRLLRAASDATAAANEIMTGGARPLHT